MVFRPDKKLGLRQEGIKKIFYRNGFEQLIQVLALAFCMSYDFVNCHPRYDDEERS